MRSVLNHEYVSLGKFTESYREATIVHLVSYNSNVDNDQPP